MNPSSFCIADVWCYSCPDYGYQYYDWVRWDCHGNVFYTCELWCAPRV